MSEADAIKRALERERKARKQAEQIIEEKSLEIYRANKDLKELNLSLEGKILERTKELNKAKEEAEESTRAKSQFLSNMSHEIRTPLNGIIGITEIMMRESGEDHIKEMLQTVKYSADNLLGIINDILDFSKIEAGKVIFESLEFDIRKLFDNLEAVFLDRVKEKNLELKFEISENIPPVFVGDRVKLNQILINLLGNAIKFTEQGYVKVNADFEKKDELSGFLKVSVSDTGIGISEDKLDRVFESFIQSHSSIGRKFGGTGLGLTITKRLVELQHGEISVESVEGKGSEFIFSVPYKIAVGRENEAKEVVFIDASDLKGIRVLVVEDNTINQFVAASFLKNWKVVFEIANNGQEAIDILEHEGFDVVLMDLHMPVMNGFEASRKIRKSSLIKNAKDVPIIALSADAFEENKKKVLDAGMNDFTTKPIIQNELLEKLLMYCPKRRSR